MDPTPIPCVCPVRKDGSPRHASGDTVTFKDPEAVDFRTASNMRNSVRSLDGSALGHIPEIATAMTEGYLRYGISSWTLKDDRDKPIPVDSDAVDTYILRNYRVAITLGEAADVVFAETVLLPLLREVSNSSPATPTESSTSPTNGPSPTLPTPLKRSSTTTSRMAGTGTRTASPDGDSNSLPSLESVGA